MSITSRNKSLALSTQVMLMRSEDYPLLNVHVTNASRWAQAGGWAHESLEVYTLEVDGGTIHRLCIPAYHRPVRAATINEYALQIRPLPL